MSKMVVSCVLFLLFLVLSGLTNSGQESVTLLSLHDDPTATTTLLPHTSVPIIAVSATDEHLKQLSSSVLMAETWLKTHVLSHFPATHITVIVVGTNVLCNREHEDLWDLILPSLKNIHHSLVRWDLEKEIKVSAAFSQDCIDPFSDRFRADLSESLVKPILAFLMSSNSTYSVNPPPPSSNFFSPSLVYSHVESIKKLGFFKLKDGINVITRRKSSKSERPTKRKLSFTSISSNARKPVPAKPTPLPPSSLRSSIGFSVPSHAVNNPLAPLPQTLGPSPSLVPPPLVLPSNPPDFSTGPSPSCSNLAPEASGGVVKDLWCVAKPSVPLEILQEAMDYACGEGGGDCEEIRPNGSCYYPDTVNAHASYAFNSYWQKNKKNGGSCSFGGSAMIINADPSYEQCQFTVV